VLDAHDHRSLAAPDRRRNGAAGLLRQRRQFGHGQRHRIDHLQADQAQLHRQRPQPVVAAHRFLHDQPQFAKAHQVGVRLGRCHASGARQILERHAASAVRQRLEQLAAHFHALNPARGAICLGQWAELGFGRGD